ncbi:response regulator transcription factor [Nocardioides acrostichi]|uniref:Response regulator transcription factor n=1 Tax=Nocardioides acrostichi TaxID=2784339 RepID=A0A930V220_9ACTN|nr:response regulator transcription factor [Nocardioides acrostichi]MBF4162599.1 response regulator transcription factor [Nocardioides acrostichi]
MSGSRPVRVALIDNFEVSVAGLRSLLAPYAGRVSLLDTESAALRPTSVDVVLYEPVRQSPTSQTLLRDLMRSSRSTAVVYSWRDPDTDQRGSFAGHLSKALPAAQLVMAIEAYHDGTARVPGRIPPDQGALHLISDASPRDFALTTREAEILSLVTQGLTNSEIGAQLYLSINSVKTYIRAAYRKIDVTRRAQAVAWGMEHGLAPLAHLEQADDDGPSVLLGGEDVPEDSADPSHPQEASVALS